MTRSVSLDGKITIKTGKGFSCCSLQYRARWWDRRQSIRQRELEADEVDRERVRQDAEIELKRIKEIEARNIELGLMPDEDKYLGPGKVKFSLAPTSSSLVRRRPLANLATGTNEEDEEAEAAARRAKRVLVPLEYSDSEEGEMRVSKSSRTERLRALMESIPAAREDLFAWAVKWKFLDDVSWKSSLIQLQISLRYPRFVVSLKRRFLNTWVFRNLLFLNSLWVT